ncbi:amyloid protein-binding protein 2 isoform X2 [Scaptodrosophila lebanonensis]|uniref:Amyloid protein-binding protein 2 isoform X2 n=1 Tax=Drosophila lebanonensis TaxID=7225 RepID=A0A6J2TZ65_DROLE|nr:amyloid protein-binding protein 2 isoform X2 [Scaptodrosophila lebanonensis]
MEAQLFALISAACAGRNNNNNPKMLYDLSLKAVVGSMDTSVPSLDRIHKLRELPRSVLIDVYDLMSQCEPLKDTLLEELSDLDVFRRLIRHTPARSKLLRIIAALMASKKMLSRRLSEAYVAQYALQAQLQENEDEEKPEEEGQKLDPPPQQPEYSKMQVVDDDNVAGTSASCSRWNAPSNIYVNDVLRPVKSATIVDANAVANVNGDSEEDSMPEVPPDDEGEIIDFGLRLGSFLSEAGWMQESIAVLECLNERLKRMKPFRNIVIVRIDCLQRLLFAESAHCNFKMAQLTLDELMELNRNCNSVLPASLIAMTYTQISAMHFARNEYDNSHMWSVLAMRYLKTFAPARVIIDVLRQAAKACVVKRDFARANLLICQAVRRAREHFGRKHQKYGDALLDYGFFLLNVDSVFQSVNVYKEALAVRRGIFGNMNFHVAIAHEDLSYAYYVHEYSTGNFTCAQDHVDKAVEIMKNIVPSNHLILASAKRVKALLLEEIALDKMADGMDEEDLLHQSEELHNFALQLSLEVFGEVNVQTAKHYGNLGRLYQTMNRFDEAERMHQKAIKIKTDLLGPYDYEVGLSIGHLASLYNYQMKKYSQAEDLYLRSIDISLRLYGRSYSGLEYDYLGLCHVYETVHDFEKYLRYAQILENWHMLRGQNITQNKTSYPAIEEDYTIDEVKTKFFTINNKWTTGLVHSPNGQTGSTGSGDPTSESAAPSIGVN